jgi:hypothetical protein
MTEIPEHLLKRAQAAREKAASEPEAAAEPTSSSGEPKASSPTAAGGSDVTADPRIPAHLLERSRAAKAKAEGGAAEGESGGGGAVAVADRVTEVVQAPPAAAGIPVGAGPGGHTQRLLTVVKSGSIQEVKASPVDKVHTWPHLLAGEFVAALLCTAFTFVFSIFVNAPLLQLANVNQTPNPSKAPWYFLGLQELLTMFHPMIAGDDPGRRHHRADLRPVHRQEPVQQTGGPQVRDRADDRAPHVLGGARDHRLVLPGSRLQLHAAVEGRRVLRPLRSRRVSL